MKVTVTTTANNETKTTELEFKMTNTARIYKTIWGMVKNAGVEMSVDSISYDNDVDMDSRVADLIGTYRPDPEDGFMEKVN